LKKYIPLNFAIIILLAVIGILLFISMNSNLGHLVYSLDDAYIHMSISKNLALHGVWGVSSHEFSSSSSSLIWTILLAFVYYIFSPNEITPLIFNIIPALLIIVSVYVLLKKWSITGNYYLFSVLILMILLPPLPPLIFTGLEHVLHILLSILFIFFASEALSVNNNRKYLWVAAIISILLPVIRYEGIVIVAGFCYLLLIQKKFIPSILIFISSLIPVFIFGVLSISKGWSFFPNSLMLKANLPDVYSIGDFIYFISVLSGSFLQGTKLYLFVINALFIISSITIYLMMKSPAWLKKSQFNLISLLLFNIALYLVYSRSGWSYRYQSLIISLSVFVLSVILRRYFSQNYIGAKWKVMLVRIVSVIIILFISYNGIKLMNDVPLTTRNIYEQQYQMGLFLKDYYYGSAVALNDIGTCNYFADIKCVDLWGLSNLEISKLRRSGNFTEQSIMEITAKNKVRIAIVYDSWFEEDGSVILPKEWIKAGEWKITDNIIAGDDVISFYSLNSLEESLLESNLRNYSSKLPKTIIQKGKYLN